MRSGEARLLSGKLSQALSANSQRSDPVIIPVAKWTTAQGSNPHPLQWKCGVSTNRPPGKSQGQTFLTTGPGGTQQSLILSLETKHSRIHLLRGWGHSLARGLVWSGGTQAKLKCRKPIPRAISVARLGVAKSSGIFRGWRSPHLHWSHPSRPVGKTPSCSLLLRGLTLGATRTGKAQADLGRSRDCLR